MNTAVGLTREKVKKIVNESGGGLTTVRENLLCTFILITERVSKNVDNI